MNEPELLRADDNCLDAASLEAFLDGRLPAARVHLDACPACAHMAASLLEFQTGQTPPEFAADAAWIEERLEKRLQLQPRKRGWLPWLGPSPLPRWAFSVAALLLIIAGGLQLRRMATPEFPGERGSSGAVVRSNQIHVLAPAGDLTSSPSLFEWQVVPQASSYKLELQEVDGAVIWTGESKDSHLLATSDIQGLILPRKALLWKVKALSQDGSVLGESAPQRFRVSPPENN